MRIRDAVEQLGIAFDGNLAVCIVKPTKAGKWLHFTLDECGDKAVNGDLYIASGLFLPNTITRDGGRVEENVGLIPWLPFDFDLSDYLGCSKEDVWATSQDELNDYIAALRTDIEEVFGLIGLPIHRLDYTGYGLAAFTYLPPHKPESVKEIRRLHKAIVARVNRVYGRTLADPQVSDAGTRIMRLVPCTNTKGPIPRQSETIYRIAGTVDEPRLRSVAGDVSLPPGRAIAKTGKRLSDGDADSIIAAVTPHWTLGQKHWMSLALAGMFAKAGVPEEQAEAIVDQLSSTDDNPNDRRNSVHDSYEKWRSGLQLQGFMSLKQMMPEDVLTFVDTVLDNVRQATTGTVTVGGKRSEQTTSESPVEAVEFSAVPDSALVGWMGRYVEVMTPTTEAPLAFHLGVGLTLAGAVIGRHVHARYGSDPLYANLYTLLIGRSGKSRKDTSIKRATRILTDPHHVGTRIISPEPRVTTDVGSAEGLIQVLSNQPNTLLYLTEFSKLMGNARRKSTTTIIPTLIEAWDTPPIMENRNKVNPLEARYPYLSILSATQPDILANLMADEDMHSGFANRWLYFCGTGTGPIPVPPPVDKAAANKLYLDLDQTRQQYEEDAALEIGAEAQERWVSWYIADYERDSQTTEEDAMRVRHSVLIQKIALIYAVTDGAQAIHLEHLEPAIAIVEWMWRNVAQLMGAWGRTIDGQIENKIREILDLNGAMKRWHIQAKCSNRKWSAKDFAQVFEAMVKNGTLVVDPAGMVARNVD